MKKQIKKIAAVLIIGLLLFTASSCIKYGKGNGGAVFFACDDCVPLKTLYVYVDGEKIHGRLEERTYSVTCGPPCAERNDLEYASYPSYIGPEGDHTFEIKDLSGIIYQSGTFRIDNKECTRIQTVTQGCIGNSGGGGGGGGGGGLPSNYQNQGTITVRSYSLNICMRDFATIDGDKIDLVINGTTVLSNKEVTGTNQCYNLTLQSPTGNWIGVIARSEGSIPPCTPGISVNDGFTTQDFEIRSYVGGINGAYIINVN
jgi:hypothetical protein